MSKTGQKIGQYRVAKYITKSGGSKMLTNVRHSSTNLTATCSAIFSV